MRKYLRMFGYLRPYRGKAAIFLFCAVGFAVFSALPALLINDFLENILSVGSRARATLHHLAGMFLACFLLMGYFEYRRLYLGRWLAASCVRDVNNQLMDHLFTLELSFFDKRRSGDLISRLNHDTAAFQLSIEQLTILVREPITIVGLMVAALVIDWRLALIGFVGFPLGALAISPLLRRVRRASRRAREKTADRTDAMTQIFGGVRIVQAYGLEKPQGDAYHEVNERIFKHDLRKARASSLSRPILQTVNGLGAALVILVGGGMVISGTLAAPRLFSFLAALMLLHRPIKSLLRAVNRAHDALPGAERVFELLDTQPGIVDADGAQTLEQSRGEIRFEAVDFSYGREPVLRGIDLTIEAGETIGIVGPSGAGKSTLASLIGRFYEPTAGRVRIDGRDQSEFTLASLRRQIAVVTQDPYLFNTTIGNNIAWGRRGCGGRDGASEEQIFEAAKAANIHDEILALPDGYATLAGERGLQMSGGQRQRIAIARAIVRDSPILVLDEATSSLDSASEQIVQAAIDRLVKDRTSVVIAHRLSTVRNAHRIVVLVGGRIERVGAHDELLASCSTYRRLWQAQEMTAPGEAAD